MLFVMFGRLLFFSSTIRDELKLLRFISECYGYQCYGFAFIADANLVSYLHMTSCILSSIVAKRWLSLTSTVTPWAEWCFSRNVCIKLPTYIVKIVTYKFMSIVTKNIIWSTRDADPMFNKHVHWTIFLIITALLNPLNLSIVWRYHVFGSR